MSDFELPPRRSDAVINPYAAPKADLSTSKLSDDVIDITEAEHIRQNHIWAEAALRAVGFLNYLGSLLIGSVSIVFFIASLKSTGNTQAVLFGTSLLFFCPAAGNYVLGKGLRDLKNWARISNAVLYIITIFNPVSWLILYYLLNKKAVFVCTPEYAEIREMTPHIEYKPSPILRFFLILLEFLSQGLITGLVLILGVAMTTFT